MHNSLISFESFSSVCVCVAFTPAYVSNWFLCMARALHVATDRHPCVLPSKKGKKKKITTLSPSMRLMIASCENRIDSHRKGEKNKINSRKEIKELRPWHVNPTAIGIHINILFRLTILVWLPSVVLILHFIISEKKLLHFWCRRKIAGATDFSIRMNDRSKSSHLLFEHPIFDRSIENILSMCTHSMSFVCYALPSTFYAMSTMRQNFKY